MKSLTVYTLLFLITKIVFAQSPWGDQGNADYRGGPTVTPTADPNTSTPGSTLMMESRTEPTYQHHGPSRNQGAERAELSSAPDKTRGDQGSYHKDPPSARGSPSGDQRADQSDPSPALDSPNGDQRADQLGPSPALDSPSGDQRADQSGLSSAPYSPTGNQRADQSEPSSARENARGDQGADPVSTNQLELTTNGHTGTLKETEISSTKRPPLMQDFPYKSQASLQSTVKVGGKVAEGQTENHLTSEHTKLSREHPGLRLDEHLYTTESPSTEKESTAVRPIVYPYSPETTSNLYKSSSPQPVVYLYPQEHAGHVSEPVSSQPHVYQYKDKSAGHVSNFTSAHLRNYSYPNQSASQMSEPSSVRASNLPVIQSPSLHPVDNPYPHESDIHTSARQTDSQYKYDTDSTYSHSVAVQEDPNINTESTYKGNIIKFATTTINPERELKTKQAFDHTNLESSYGLGQNKDLSLMQRSDGTTQHLEQEQLPGNTTREMGLKFEHQLQDKTKPNHDNPLYLDHLKTTTRRENYEQSNTYTTKPTTSVDSARDMYRNEPTKPVNRWQEEIHKTINRQPETDATYRDYSYLEQSRAGSWPNGNGNDQYQQGEFGMMTPTADPNTSTPGSTSYMLAITEPSRRRKVGITKTKPIADVSGKENPVYSYETSASGSIPVRNVEIKSLGETSMIQPIKYEHKFVINGRNEEPSGQTLNQEPYSSSVHTTTTGQDVNVAVRVGSNNADESLTIDSSGPKSTKDFSMYPQEKLASSSNHSDIMINSTVKHVKIGNVKTGDRKIDLEYEKPREIKVETSTVHPVLPDQQRSYSSFPLVTVTGIPSRKTWEMTEVSAIEPSQNMNNEGFDKINKHETEINETPLGSQSGSDSRDIFQSRETVISIENQRTLETSTTVNRRFQQTTPLNPMLVTDAVTNTESKRYETEASQFIHHTTKQVQYPDLARENEPHQLPYHETYTDTHGPLVNTNKGGKEHVIQMHKSSQDRGEQESQSTSTKSTLYHDNQDTSPRSEQKPIVDGVNTEQKQKETIGQYAGQHGMGNALTEQRQQKEISFTKHPYGRQSVSQTGSTQEKASYSYTEKILFTSESINVEMTQQTTVYPHIDRHTTTMYSTKSQIVDKQYERNETSSNALAEQQRNLQRPVHTETGRPLYSDSKTTNVQQSSFTETHQPEYYGTYQQGYQNTLQTGDQKTNHQGYQNSLSTYQEPQQTYQDTYRQPYQETNQQPHHEPYQQPYQEPHQQPHQEPHQQPNQEPHQQPYQETHQQVYPQSQHPFYTEREQSSYSVTQQPAVTEIRHAAFTETRQPAYTENRQSVYTETRQPAYTENRQSAYTETRQPAYTETRQSAYTETNQPAYTETRQSAYTETHQPTYTETHQPAYTNNRQTGYTEVHQPAHTETRHPAYTEINKPSYTEIHQPAYTETQRPEYRETYHPSYQSNPSSMPPEQQRTVSPYKSDTATTAATQVPAQSPYSPQLLTEPNDRGPPGKQTDFRVKPIDPHDGYTTVDSNIDQQHTSTDYQQGPALSSIQQQDSGLTSSHLGQRNYDEVQHTSKQVTSGDKTHPVLDGSHSGSEPHDTRNKDNKVSKTIPHKTHSETVASQHIYEKPESAHHREDTSNLQKWTPVYHPATVENGPKSDSYVDMRTFGASTTHQETLQPIPQDPMSERVHPIPQDPRSERVHPIPQDPRSERVHPIPQDPRSERVHPIPQDPTSERVHPIPQDHRLERVHPIPQDPRSERVHPIPQDPRSERVHPIPQDPRSERVHPIPQDPRSERVHPIPQDPRPERVHPIPQDPTSERVHPIPQDPRSERVHPIPQDPRSERVHSLGPIIHVENTREKVLDLPNLKDTIVSDKSNIELNFQQNGYRQSLKALVGVSGAGHRGLNTLPEETNQINGKINQQEYYPNVHLPDSPVKPEANAFGPNKWFPVKRPGQSRGKSLQHGHRPTHPKHTKLINQNWFPSSPNNEPHMGQGMHPMVSGPKNRRIPAHANAHHRMQPQYQYSDGPNTGPLPANNEMMYHPQSRHHPGAGRAGWFPHSVDTSQPNTDHLSGVERKHLESIQQSSRHTEVLHKVQQSDNPTIDIDGPVYSETNNHQDGHQEPGQTSNNTASTGANEFIEGSPADSFQDHMIPTLESLCVHSSYIDGIGYAQYPGRCDKLVQCYNYRGRDIAVLRDCPYGYFWHQDQVLCRSPGQVPCYEDPCLNIDVMQYNRTGGCRSYYFCEYGVSLPMCCEIGSRFDGTTCVQDHTCYDPCSTPYDIEESLNSQSCKFLPDEYNPYGYLTMEHNGLRIRACPSGTVFSASQCGCRPIRMKFNTSRPRMKRCSPEFSIDFNQGFKEQSGSNMAFDVSKVVLHEGSAIFDGDGKITLWGYMNRDLGKDFVIKMRFKSNVGPVEVGSLISNCGMTGEPTISIDIENGKLVASAKSKSFSKVTKIIADLIPNEWNEVTYIYDSSAFIVKTIDGYHRTPITGLLETSTNALVIGGCPKEGYGFRGLIDKVDIYSGCIPFGMYKKPKRNIAIETNVGQIRGNPADDTHQRSSHGRDKTTTDMQHTSQSRQNPQKDIHKNQSNAGQLVT